ncbi:hypothetical protein IMX26_14405 [Clostridium sp. 'deep sea']|uniref:hypothetical protein n=1 Tax=Clostridium sp. 'deep sea' TaxID=2779445 RepID=UPI00189663D6|nr:hypothetical protein [Clostridium sp. 'deep sea']QOR34649.1 hypothetical protein IMX26_14405 [Clostridium sp. 'deep sea']
MTYINIYIIICAVILSIESILMMLKITNITSTFNINYYLMSYWLAYFKKYDVLLCIILIIMLIAAIHKYKNPYLSYKIINVANENVTDINLILNKYLKQGYNIELKYKDNSMILKLPRPKYEELKPVIKEIDRYLRGNGKTSKQNKIRVVVFLCILIVSVIVGVIK